MQRREYAYHPDGRLASLRDAVGGERRYELDRAGRVTGVHGPGWREAYTYDPAGNLRLADWPAEAGVHGTGPRDYAGSLPVKAGRLGYRYDADGRVVARGGTQLGWDADNRLRWAKTPDGRTWRYSYDAFGRRIRKELLGADGASVAQRTDFVWDGDDLAEQIRDGAEALTWDWSPAKPVVLAQTARPLGGQPGDARFLAVVPDPVGTPIDLLSADGRLAGHRRSTLWGLPAGGDGAGTPLAFPGQYQDTETGLHYNGHRYYDPVLAAYLSHDPLGLRPQPNSRSYVPNPTFEGDPLGLIRTPCGREIDENGNYIDGGKDKRGNFKGKKTQAFTGDGQHQSGWSNPSPDRFTQVPPQAVIEHPHTGPFKKHNFDPKDGSGPGHFNASHAEQQASHNKPGDPIIVSRPMCSSCRTGFQARADNSGITHYVGDQKGIHEFTPGSGNSGSMHPNPGHGVDGIDPHGRPYM
ncbi:MAG: RHS repeat domain-containing protein, partial [Acidimicrobiales bacterium]